MKSKYIGVTGFMSVEEVQVLGGLFTLADINLCKIRFRAGILMSKKTLLGQTNKYPYKYPKREKLAGILAHPHHNADHIIHYSTDELDTLAFQLMALMGMYEGVEKITSGYLTGFQINATWPPLEQIQAFRGMCAATNKETELILQVGSRAFDEVNNSPDELFERLKPYEEIVDYVLLDPSGGTGTPMNVGAIRGFVEKLRPAERGYGLGIAGGLCAEELTGDIETLLRDFPLLSIDAEGRLRGEFGALDITKARNYIKRALDIFKENYKKERELQKGA